MYYIIFDLEWNNAYNYSTGKGMNEIIEIGAVKLDEKLNIVDTFKQLIKPKISKKLTGRFKNLTHITADEINEYGIPFQKAIEDFAFWSGKESIFMSWSNSDLYVLTDNFKKFMGTTSIDFMTKYVDMQKYCQAFLDDLGRNQISLAHCAERFNITVDTENLHRALEDCYLSAKCLEKVFDRKKFNKYIVECDLHFFEKLIYKPFILTNPVTPEYNVYNEKLYCPICGAELRVLKKYEVVNKSFKTVCECKPCKRKFWAYVRVKKNYDDISVSKRVCPMNKKRANNIDRASNSRKNIDKK